jgi:hypothetical protein
MQIAAKSNGDMSYMAEISENFSDDSNLSQMYISV